MIPAARKVLEFEGPELSVLPGAESLEEATKCAQGNLLPLFGQPDLQWHVARVNVRIERPYADAVAPMQLAVGARTQNFVHDV